MTQRNEWLLEVYGEAVGCLDGLGFEASVMVNYSGRAMFGKTVPAIVTDAPGTMVGWAVMAAVVDIRARRGDTDAVSLLDGSDHAIPRKIDNMGLSFVYY